MTPFYCPTRILSQTPWLEALPGLLGERSWVLATSAGWLARGVVERLAEAGLKPDGLLPPVAENPLLSRVIKAYGDLPPCEVIVALGGGSVMDAAKGLMALRRLEGDGARFEKILRDGGSWDAPFGATPALIAVPTTAGTGSEVTRWGTIWGDDGYKLSVSHESLFPQAAVLDPMLCRSMPRVLTLGTGLDVLSHAMEAIWNKNHAPLADQFAVQAIELTLDALPRVLEYPDDLAWRGTMQTAALMAGLAMGTTQTALAHAISYPFTAELGLPHGLACGFPLAEVARFNTPGDPERMRLLTGPFNCALEALPEAVTAFLERVGTPAALRPLLPEDPVARLTGTLAHPTRSVINLRMVDDAEARGVARAALARLLA